MGGSGAYILCVTLLGERLARCKGPNEALMKHLVWIQFGEGIASFLLYSAFEGWA
jgi:hypothetical protein